MRVNVGDAIALRYRLVPGSTVRWVVRMDVDLCIETPGATDETMIAMVTSAVDCEVLRLEGQTALVRPFAHRSDFWVKDGTLDEDDVADPMAGFVKAFLLDDLGSVVPVVNERAEALADSDDGNAGRVLLLALFPPYPEPAIETSMQWEVGLHPSWSATSDLAMTCELARLARSDDGPIVPIVTHTLAYDWSKDATGPNALGAGGSVAFSAETRVDPRDGWAEHTQAKATLVTRYTREDGALSTVTTALNIVATRE